MIKYSEKYEKKYSKIKIKRKYKQQINCTRKHKINQRNCLNIEVKK